MAAFQLALAIIIGIFNAGFAELTVDVNPKKVLSKKGSSVSIDCVVSGTTKPAKVTWTFNGEAVENTEERKILANNTLYISVLRSSYKGEYKCEASIDSAPPKSDIVTVDIAVIRKLPEMADQSEFTGNDIAIVCPEPKKDSKPVPDLRWEVGGKPLPKIARYVMDKRTLTIKALVKEDTNNYTCIVNNSAGTRMQTMNLLVYVRGSQKVSPINIVKLEGEEAVFQCISTTDPPLPSELFKWTKKTKGPVVSDDRIEVTTDGKLRFKKVLPTDNGTYSCSVVPPSTSAQFFSADGHLKVINYLKVDQSKFRKTQSLDRKSNKTHAIKFAYTGDGFLSIRWEKVGLSSLPTRMKASGNSLVIKDLQFKDGGEYKCILNGKYNNISVIITVNVFEGAEFTKKPNNITVKEGGSASTVCDGIGKPKPRITWAKAESDPNLPKNFNVVKNTTLVIDNAILSNTGTYFCMIANGPTSRNVEFEVKVKKSNNKKGTPKAQQSMGRTVGIAVGCAGAYILLVIGLMIYCRSRRSRMLKRQGNIATEIEDGEFNKDLLENGDEEYPMNGDLRNLEQWYFPREDVTEESVLGHGKYGKVYIAKARGINESGNEVLVAVKQLIKGNEEAREGFDQELDMLTQLKHPNVIKLLGVCVKDFPLLMIMEYSEHGDLKQFVSKPENLSTANKVNICFEITKAMDYLTVNGIIHHDLACRNCLVTSKDCHVKVAFFSLSEDAYAEDYCLYNGAHVPLRWLSPEALLQTAYSEKSGVWAFAVVMWEVFSNGKRPYPGKTDEEVVKSIKKKNQLEVIDDMPEQLAKLMKNSFRINPDERPKFSDIVTTFEEMPTDSNV